MKSQAYFFGFILLVFISLVDLYSYRGVARLAENMDPSWERVIKIVFFALTAVAILLILRMIIVSGKMEYSRLMNLMKRSMGYFILIYVPKLFFIFFLLVRDFLLLAENVVRYFTSSGPSQNEALLISRGDFILRFGVVVAIIPFLSILYGIWKGKYNYRISRINLQFPDFPTEFNGLKIVQLSDMHLGSFDNDPDKISPAIDLINAENPDIVLFTGDLVNNIASEAAAFTEELARIKAKMGKFSILGNHDYGTYYKWESQEELAANMIELYDIHKRSGFELLRNESVLFEKEGARIALAGVENWGEPPFPQFGDIEKAMEGTGEAGFKILMSHDPSHWDAKIRPESDIDLTLSGHTHGMQFAIRIPGWRWSPVKFKYPRWAGLYREGNQFLYVNIGLGFIGFPGRVGTPPEISVFEIKKGNLNGVES